MSDQRVAIDEKLGHELGNALMAVLTHAELLDRRYPDDPQLHAAIDRIKAAVLRSRTTVDEVRQELQEIARRLAAPLP